MSHPFCMNSTELRFSTFQLLFFSLSPEKPTKYQNLICKNGFFRPFFCFSLHTRSLFFYFLFLLFFLSIIFYLYILTRLCTSDKNHHTTKKNKNKQEAILSHLNFNSGRLYKNKHRILFPVTCSRCCTNMPFVFCSKPIYGTFRRTETTLSYFPFTFFFSLQQSKK